MDVDLPLQVLASWLNHNPNYDEVTRWYKGWKSLIPPDVAAQPQVSGNLSQALEMMVRVVNVASGHPMSMQPGANEAINYLSSVEQSSLDMGASVPHATPPLPPSMRSMPVPPPPPSMTSVPRPPPPPSISGLPAAPDVSTETALGYKDLVMKRCAERGIYFAPCHPPKFKDGRQVFRCGNSNIYLDKSAILVQNGDRWIPTSLNSLLDSAI